MWQCCSKWTVLALTLLECILATQSTFMLNDSKPLGNSELLNSKFDEYVEDLLATYHVPGLSVAVVDIRDSSAGRIESKGYGFANFPSSVATPDTLYFTGSTSKAFTAAAVGKLLQQNQNCLTWASRIRDILGDEFELIDDYYTHHVTIEDALSHRSGLPRHDLAYGPANVSEMTRLMRFLPITREPRTKFQYCNLMYVTVSCVIEKLSGRELVSFLTEWFWRPLGMQSTMFQSSSIDIWNERESSPHLSRGYYWAQEDEDPNTVNQSKIQAPSGYYVPEPYPVLSGLSGAGAVISSANDYALWLRAFLQAASHRGLNSSSPLDMFLFHELLTPRTILPRDLLANPVVGSRFAIPPDYALGWITSFFNGRLMLSHPGSVIGFGTEVYVLPEDGVAVVTMGNTAITSNLVGSLASLMILKNYIGIDEGIVQEVELGIRKGRSIAGIQIDGFETGFGTSTVPTLSSDEHDIDGFLEQDSTDHLKDTKNFFHLTGSYSNDGYGRINITARGHADDFCYICNDACTSQRNRSNHNTDPSGTRLHVVPSTRVWPYTLCLQPLSMQNLNGTIFEAELWQPHGPYAPDAFSEILPTCNGQVNAYDRLDVDDDFDAYQSHPCEDKVIWIKIPSKQLAYFEINAEGQTIRLGLELESEMTQAVKEDRGRYSWKDSMIWFERS